VKFTAISGPKQIVDPTAVAQGQDAGNRGVNVLSVQMPSSPRTPASPEEKLFLKRYQAMSDFFA